MLKTACLLFQARFLRRSLLLGFLVVATLASRDVFAQSSSVGNLNAPRVGHTATLLSDGRVLITGGYSAVNSTELYDPIAETFSPA